VVRLWIAARGSILSWERGASMLEYAFLIALIAIVVVTAALYFGVELNSNFSEVGATMQAA
jgi:Flp pilus assembly pilin Flp